MLKRFFLLAILLSSSFLFSEELKSEKFNILAKEINTKDNFIIASGNVVVYSKTFYLSANRIKFNKLDESLELFDNVLIMKDNRIQTQSNYAFVSLKDNSYNQSPVFLMDNQSKLWINSKSSNKTNKELSLDESIISSCDCIDPDWSIKVSSANFNIKDEWLHVYNPRLYIKDVPVLYSPYFGFPTGTKRKSGLLMPTIGYSNNDGLFYSQPAFWAPAQDFDFEFVPQIREKRGYGIYTYFRYADSKDSILKLKTGIFREKEAYKEEYELENSKHFGWNIDYTRKNIFSSKDDQDGLFASINWLNDIEYKTLEKDENSTSTEKKVESKINYFYNTPSYYTGAYLRYYIDTELDTNEGTLQELPQVQFHKYNKEITNNLLYLIDTKYRNFTRTNGVGADISELSLPISYGTHLLNDYLFFNITNEWDLTSYNYKNDSNLYNDAKLLQNKSSLSLGSDLLKPYKNYIHTINLNAKYTLPRNLQKEGDIYSISSENESLAVFPVSQEERNIKLSLNQSLYNRASLKEIITHKLSQSILYDDNKKAKSQDLENYLKYNFSSGSISNKIIYNMQDKKVVENAYDFVYDKNKVNLELGYYKSKNTNNSSRENLESYRAKALYRISREYDISYYENYNLLDELRNKQGVSLNIYDNCWSLAITYENEIIPSSTSTSDDTIEQRVLYLNLKLKPLGGVKQKYKFENK